MTTKVLDFNSAQRPTLELTMMDDDRTVLRVKTPPESMIRELENMSEDLEKLKTGDRDSVEMIYDLAARLMSCNRSFLTVTVEDLRGKYRMELEDLLLFFNMYFDFITELTNEKN